MAGEETRLFSPCAIARRVDALAGEIAAASVKPEVAVPILTGAFVFAADLLRALAAKNLDLPVESVWLRSYGVAERPQGIEILIRPGIIVRDKNILVIDGVLDSGATLATARDLLLGSGARSVMSAVAVAKKHPRRAIEAEYVGFNTGSEFIYGYGMDRAGLGRGLPDIRIAREEN